MPLKGLEEFEENLKKLDRKTVTAAKVALEVAANNVVTHAKAGHRFARSLDLLTVASHPDKRFYTRTAKLVNSIRIGDTRETMEGVETEVLAGDPGLVTYAVFVEKGTRTAREFPFLEPALKETAQVNLEVIANILKRMLR